MAALGRFISKLGERGLPLFKLLKKTGLFDWTPEAEQAFRDLKKYLISPPVLVAPSEGEPLLLYVSATPQVIIMVLVVERNECTGSGAGSQLPVAPGHSPVLVAPPEQGVEPEHLAPPQQGVESEHLALSNQGVEPEHPVSPTTSLSLEAVAGPQARPQSGPTGYSDRCTSSVKSSGRPK